MGFGPARSFFGRFRTRDCAFIAAKKAQRRFLAPPHLRSRRLRRQHHLSKAAGFANLAASWSVFGDQASGGFGRASLSIPRLVGASDALTGQTFRNWASSKAFRAPPQPRSFFGDKLLDEPAVSRYRRPIAPGVMVGFSRPEPGLGIDWPLALQSANMD